MEGADESTELFDLEKQIIDAFDRIQTIGQQDGRRR